jgi:hypothetical protein
VGLALRDDKYAECTVGTADNLASLYCCPHVKGLRLDEISYFVAVIILLKSCTHTLPDFTNTLGGSIHRGFALFWCEGE